MALDHAIAIIPPDEPRYLRARLYSYRATAKKRLGRLEEAKSDAEIAKSLADRSYELMDATYNLAGIEAMLGNRDAALRQLRELAQLGSLNQVRGHLDDYFKSLKDDPEFQELVGVTSVLGSRDRLHGISGRRVDRWLLTAVRGHLGDRGLCPGQGVGELSGLALPCLPGPSAGPDGHMPCSFRPGSG